MESDACSCEAATKSQVQRRVEDFMRWAGQAVRSKPQEIPEDERILRATLIYEEAMETIEALGVAIHYDFGVSDVGIKFVIDGPMDLVEVVDGCTDQIVIAEGTLSACGVADRGPMEEVLQSNQRKFDGGYRRSDGKWMKPADWEPPKIREALVAQGYEPEGDDER